MATAKKYLSYFQGSVPDWEAPDQRLLRHAIPENRLRVYEMRAVIEQLFDVDSVLELRAEFGVGMITALARIDGGHLFLLQDRTAFPTIIEFLSG